MSKQLENKENIYRMLHEFRNWNRDWDKFIAKKPDSADDFVAMLAKKYEVTPVSGSILSTLELKSLHELDAYVTDNNDQPTTCPKCSGRTEFEDIADDKQQHKCLSCEYEFFLDFEDEE